MSADPVGTIINELRGANIASGRVRGEEADPGDARDPGHYQRFVVVTDIGGPPVRNIIQRKRIMIRCYGATYQDAGALYGEVQELLHLRGVRATGSKPILQSRDNTGGSEHHDPETGQPYYDGVFVVTQWIGPSL